MNVLKGDRSIPIPIRTQCQRIVDHAGRLRGYVRRNSVYFTILNCQTATEARYKAYPLIGQL